MGPDQQPVRAAVRDRAAGVQNLLDRRSRADLGLPRIATFRDWLLAESAEDARRLKALIELEGPGRARAKPRAKSGTIRALRQDRGAVSSS